MAETGDRYAHVMTHTYGAPRRVLVSGEGCYVDDEQGNRYLDLLAGLAVNALGHAHAVIVNDCTPRVVRLAPPLIIGPEELTVAADRLGAAWAAATAQTLVAEVAS